MGQPQTKSSIKKSIGILEGIRMEYESKSMSNSAKGQARKEDAVSSFWLHGQFTQTEMC